MVTSQKILRVFLASPSDMQEERRYARECVDEWNDVNGERSGWYVDLLGWEDTLPQAGRPQAIINEDVNRCMMFIGMMHRLWGNRTGSGHTSGFHEEFLLAESRHESTGEPHISLFFKDAGALNDPGDQLKKVISFKEEITESKRHFYKSLPSDTAEWQPAFRRVVHKLIFKIIAKYDDQSSSSVSESEGADHSSSRNQPALISGPSRERIEAAKQILAKIESFDTDYDVSALDIARLRLVGVGWRSTGLSEMSVGTHDANFVYSQADIRTLSLPEISALVDCGVAHIASQNAPLWKWLYHGSEQVNAVRLAALFSSEDSVRSGAFTVLGLINDDFGGYRDLLTSQFSEFSAVSKSAALRYIGAIGDSEFLQLCLDELTISDPSTLNDALLAIVGILSRDSASEALLYLINENRFPTGEWHDRNAIILAMDDLADSAVEKALLHRDASIRIAAVRTLSNRKPLPAATSSALRSDPSASVRMAAVEVALQSGETLSLGDIEKILVRTKRNAFMEMRKEGEEEFAKLREIVFRGMSDDELSEELDSFYTPANIAYATLLQRHWKQRSKSARSDLSDGFDEYFARLKRSYTNRFGESSANSMVPTGELMDYVAWNMIKATLAVFANKGDSKDIRFFREAIKNKYYTIQPHDLAFFAKYGDWTDILPISNASRAVGFGLFAPNTVSDVEIASAIRKIAGSRLFEVLKMDIRPSIKSAIVKSFPQNAFRSLSDEAIISLLNDTNDEIRRRAAIKVTETISKDRVTKLISNYLKQSYIYYNVIHWLDLKISAPLHISRLVSASR
ncbi:DUF4062 domain-containing protein [Brevundimonas nasdae]|uniref:DUF4062 domain-containing protein n=1 Tax=Brevundimonas nasdae TaxID=172043 RepID=UPI00301A79E4